MNNPTRRLFMEAGTEYHIYTGVNFAGYVKPHSHTFHQILFVTKGKITQSQDGREYHQTVGDVFFTPAGREHSLVVHGKETTYYCLSLTDDISETAFRSFRQLTCSFADFPGMYTPSLQIYNQIAELMQVLIQCNRINPQDDRQTGMYMTVALLCALIIPIFVYNALPQDQQKTKAAFDMAQCIRFVDEHYRDNLAVDQLSKMCALSPASFCTKFSSATGNTLKHYITEKRIEQAKLLCSSGLSLSGIANKVGYTDYSSFHRNFMQYVGISPSTYRKKIQSPSRPRHDPSL